MKVPALIAALFAFASVSVTAAAEPTPIQIGMSHTIESTALNEARTVTVVLPPSYAREPNRRYPLLFVIDGGVGVDVECTVDREFRSTLSDRQCTARRRERRVGGIPLGWLG